MMMKRIKNLLPRQPKSHRIFMGIGIVVFTILVFNSGMWFENIQRRTPLAGCSMVFTDPGIGYELMTISPHVAKMFKDYYNTDVELLEYYVPNGMLASDYLKTLGYGGFHYFKDTKGHLYQCGFSK